MTEKVTKPPAETPAQIYEALRLAHLSLDSTLTRLADSVAVGPALLLTAGESAALCGMGESTFLRLVSAGDLPRQVTLTDGLAQWRRRDIERVVAGLKTRSRTPRTATRERNAPLPHATNGAA